MKNFDSYLIIIAYCFFQVDCRSIHFQRDVLSRKDMHEGKSVNYHEGRRIISWKKLKPILRKEVQSQNLNGVDAIKKNPGFTENAQVIHKISNEDFSKNHRKEDLPLKLEQQLLNKTKLDFVINNQTFESENFILNITDNKVLKLDAISTTNDMSYAKQPNILTESRYLSVFPTLNNYSNKLESFDSEESSLLSEGTVVASQEVLRTENEVLTGFETEQEVFQTKLPNLQIKVKRENKFTDFTTENTFSVLNFAFSHSQENEREEIATTKREVILHENAEISTDRFENRSIDLTSITSIQGNKRAGIIYTHPKTVNMNAYPSKVDSVEDESLLNDRAGLALQKFVSTGNIFFQDIKTEQNLIQTELPILQISQKAQNNFSDLNQKDFNLSTFAFNHYLKNEQQIISTNSTSFSSETSDISTDIFENSNAANSVKDVKRIQGSIIGPKLPKCPDPGLCIFWFFAEDLCAEDRHCHGALICCMWGCSKMCVDGENGLSHG